MKKIQIFASNLIQRNLGPVKLTTSTKKIQAHISGTHFLKFHDLVYVLTQILLGYNSLLTNKICVQGVLTQFFDFKCNGIPNQRWGQLQGGELHVKISTFSFSNVGTTGWQ